MICVYIEHSVYGCLIEETNWSVHREHHTLQKTPELKVRFVTDFSHDLCLMTICTPCVFLFPHDYFIWELVQKYLLLRRT